MYTRADAGGLSRVGGQRGGGVAGLAEVSWQKGHAEEKEQERGRSRHESYVMIITKHRGRLFSTLPRLRHRPGSRKQVCAGRGETQNNLEEACRGCGRGKERQT